MLKPLIKVSNLKVIYNQGASNEVQALRGVDFEIYPKEFIVFFGPSGCGKSTVLHTLAGLEVPTSGKVIVSNMDLSQLTNQELSAYHRNELGIIFQAYNLISSLSVLENVALPQIFDSRPFRERYKRAYKILDRFGIKKEAKKLPTELSGGQQQRVGVARALINNPLIFLADEPVGNLDSKSAKVVLDFLSNLNANEGKTIILVTHNPENVHYANRIFYMRDGLIVKVIRNEKKPDLAPEQAEPLEETIERHIRSSSFDIQAKILTNRFLERYSEQEKDRFQKIVNQYLANAINTDELNAFLDKSYNKGGMGFYFQTANKITNELFYLKEEANKLKQIQTRFQDKKSLDKNLQAEIGKIREHLIQSYQGKLEEEQLDLLDNLIYQFLTKRITLEALKRYLMLSRQKGGLGLRKRTTDLWLKQISIFLANANVQHKA